MIYDRYYYSKMNSDDKKAYKLIYDALQRHEPSVEVQWITDESLLKVFEAINLDNPHLFFVDFSSITWYDLIGKTTVELSYLYDKSKTTTAKRWAFAFSNDHCKGVLRAFLSNARQQGFYLW